LREFDRERFRPRLAAAVTVAPPAQSLPTSLADTTVRVTDSAGVEVVAALVRQPSQVNYSIPEGTAVGAPR